MYILKYIEWYIQNLMDELFGKKFTYNPNIHYFADEDEKLDIIEEYGTNLHTTFHHIQKFMEINALLKQFLNAIMLGFTLFF
ncbi:MAG: hypothetical protein ACLRPW_04090 [Intestinibacter sp.]